MELFTITDLKLNQTMEEKAVLYVLMPNALCIGSTFRVTDCSISSGYLECSILDFMRSISRKDSTCFSTYMTEDTVCYLLVNRPFLLYKTAQVTRISLQFLVI